MSNLDAAVEYHRKGFSVIPIKTGTKKALVPWESYQAQPASEATLTHWFTSWPDANVGLVTGAVSDCVVIDLDSTEAKDALKRLAPDYNFSSAPRVRTGKGGYHLFFKHPGVSIKTRVAVLPKMDVRADGGYVVAAPSIHGETGKRYAWEVPLNGHLPELPGELLKLISSPASGATRSSGNIAEGGIEQGQRNATLTSLAGTMRRRAMSESSILAALQEENRTRCNPPLPEHEVEVIARSVSRYVAGDIREQVTPSANKNEGLSVPVPDENPESEFPETAFPAAAWTGLFAQWRDMIGSRTEAPTEYLWGAFLVAAGAMIGVQRGETARGHCSRIFICYLPGAPETRENRRRYGLRSSCYKTLVKMSKQFTVSSAPKV